VEGVEAPGVEGAAVPGVEGLIAGFSSAGLFSVRAINGFSHPAIKNTKKLSKKTLKDKDRNLENK
jgi:hypothetical protein